MKLIGRILWLLFGLIYRLIVLVLFERWIPFPERAPAPAAPRAPKQAPAKKEKRKERPIFTPTRAGPPRRMARPVERPFFEAESSELSPELAARLEGEHWQRARPSAPARVIAGAQREQLASMLRSRRALRDAVLLGTALGVRRPKP